MNCFSSVRSRVSKAGTSLLLTVLALFSLSAEAQPPVPLAPDTLNVVHYNLLRFPGTTGATRGPLLAEILTYLKPDIFTVNEMGTAASPEFILTNCLNINGVNYYRSARFMNGPDSHSMLFYDSRKIGLKSQDSLRTTPRLTYNYRIFHKSPLLDTYIDTVFMQFSVCHLQASPGSANEQSRDIQATAMRAYLANQVRDSSYFVTGDFNVYRGTEAAFQTFIGTGAGQLVDPINQIGAWQDNPNFARIHTQSTRTTQFGGGATGGLDDRFDFILCSPAVRNGTSPVKILPETYRAVGNDGLHLNLALIDPPTNTSEPENIIQALYQTSDHLPVFAKIVVQHPVINSLTNVGSTAPLATVSSINPTYFSLTNTQQKASFAIIDATGRIAQQGEIEANSRSQIGIEKLVAGTYFLKVYTAKSATTLRFVAVP